MTIIIYKHEVTGDIITYSPADVYNSSTDILKQNGWEEIMVVTGWNISVFRSKAVHTFNEIRKTLFKTIKEMTK